MVSVSSAPGELDLSMFTTYSWDCIPQ